MAYYLNLFSPQTYEAFSRSDQTISGFRERQSNVAVRIGRGDRLICYMTKLSRWIGILEVVDGPFEDSTPIFYPEDDPFVVRFKVKPVVWLPKELTLPIHEDDVWDTLSFTRGQDRRTSTWTGRLRSSLTQMDDADARYLESRLIAQRNDGEVYEIDDKTYERLARHTVRRPDKVVTVSVPEDDDPEEEARQSEDAPVEVRDSMKVQAALARIGAVMGMRIWIPKSDRGGVMRQWTNSAGALLDVLPLNYDETTLKTIEQIDVLWLKGRSIVRAFEVEHTTSIYSGILRMADLLALQPNMDIRLHLVAPPARRDKVFQEIKRPVFSLLERGPLADACTYISYDSVEDIGKLRHLSHLSDSVIDEYAEDAE